MKNKLFFGKTLTAIFSVLFLFSVATVFAYPGEGAKTTSTPNATSKNTQEAIFRAQESISRQDAINKAVVVGNFRAPIPANCTSWFDGCNTCSVKNGVLGGCTRMACSGATQAPKCLNPLSPDETGKKPIIDRPSSGIPTNCTSWFDGCNTCSVKNGQLLGCTQRYCFTKGVAECKNPPASQNLFSPISLWSSDFSPAKEWSLNYPRMTGDVNGDGKADLVGFGKDGVYVALSTGTGFGPISLWSSDFSPAKDWSTSFPRLTADVNNDGKADLVGFGRDGVYVALSTGTSFSPIALWSSDFTTANEWNINYPRFTADVNGDGKADLVGFGKDGVYVSLSLDKSSSTVPVRVVPMTNNVDSTAPKSSLKGDLNGDNVVDILDYNILVADFGKKI